MIYLDNSATTYPKPESVYKALDKANREFAFNAGRGMYKYAKETYNIIEDTRKGVAELADASADNVAFFSSATEALNLIINGIGIGQGDNIFISCFEHNAIVRPLYNLKKTIDFNIIFIPFDKNTWELKEGELNDLFTLSRPKAVLISHVSNVTGYILPYEKIFKLSRNFGAINVLDCAQSFGIIKPVIKDCDFIVFAGHKSLYASFGIAGFIDINDFHLNITKTGGNGSDSLNHDMPEFGHGRYESGSENSVAIIGLNSSIKWLKNNDIMKHERNLTKYLIKEMNKNVKLQLYLPANCDNIMGIVSFNIKGYPANDVGSILAEEYDICVRTGYHCSPFIHKFLDSLKFSGTVRISMGAFTTKEDIDKLIEALNTF